MTVCFHLKLDHCKRVLLLELVKHEKILSRWSYRESKRSWPNSRRLALQRSKLCLLYVFWACRSPFALPLVHEGPTGRDWASYPGSTFQSPAQMIFGTLRIGNTNVSISRESFSCLMWLYWALATVATAFPNMIWVYECPEAFSCYRSRPLVFRD